MNLWTKRIDKLPAFIEYEGVKYELEIVVKPYYICMRYVSPIDEKDILISNTITAYIEPFGGDIYQHLDNLAYDILKMIKNEVWKNKNN